MGAPAASAAIPASPAIPANAASAPPPAQGAPAELQSLMGVIPPRDSPFWQGKPKELNPYTYFDLARAAIAGMDEQSARAYMQQGQAVVQHWIDTDPQLA